MASRITLKAFGVKGDGVVDDATAFTNAIAALATGDVLVLDTDVYLGSGITFNKAAAIDGNGHQIKALASFITQSTLVTVTAANVAIDNLRLAGHSAAAGSNQMRGMYVNGVAGFKGTRLTFEDLGWVGIWLNTATDFQLRGLRFKNCQHYAPTVSARAEGCLKCDITCARGTMSGLEFQDCYGKCLTVQSSSLISAADMVFSNTQSPSAVGIYCNAAIDCSFVGVVNNGAGCCKFSAGTDGCILANVRSDCTQGDSYSLYLQGASNCRISDCDFEQTLNLGLGAVEAHPDPAGGSSTNNRFSNCRFKHDPTLSLAAFVVGSDTVGAYTNTNNFFYNCVFDGRVGVSATDAQLVEFWDCDMIGGQGGNGAGLTVTSATSIRLYNCDISGAGTNATPAVDLTGTTTAQIHNCRITTSNTIAVDLTTSTSVSIVGSHIESTNVAPVSIEFSGATGAVVYHSYLDGNFATLGTSRLFATTVRNGTTKSIYFQGHNVISESRYQNSTSGYAVGDGSFLRQSGNDLYLWNQETAAIYIGTANAALLTITANDISLAAGKTIRNVDINGAGIRWGTATPEGAVALPVGSIFLRTDGGTSTTLYVKETGAATVNGWVAK